MKHDITAFQYMRAHGNQAGPTHRPYLTGILSACLAAFPSLLVRWWSGALESEGKALGIEIWLAVILDTTVLLLAGLAYSVIFERAANDACGGWLFGLSYGFLLWMLGPVAVWQTLAGSPIAVGNAAIGIFSAQLVYGLLLGGLYPFINRAVQKQMRPIGSSDIER